MIPQTELHICDWRSELRHAVSDGGTLLARLQLNPEQLGYSALAARDFPVLVPRPYLQRITPGDPDDPLLRQVLATGQETLVEPGYSDDPVGETGATIQRPGVIQKYRGRVLLILAGGCAINCRYCFRRHFPYQENRNSRQEWLQALEHVAADTSITEVILSGGDPLLVADAALAELVATIAAIPHVRRLRVHTRLPVVIPQRVTDGLLQALTGSRLRCVMVIHSNHARELDAPVVQAMQRLREADVELLNQSVLLAGVNNHAATLVNLSERLFEIGVRPYYLHLLDKVRGAAHFDVPQAEGIALIDAMAAELPGYLVPRLVLEEAGQPGKTRIA
ncbi:EF-P beta-lysylation protein EpmB [Halioglobus sp. HI00S01]|uniref:EF-P beta-lysylation protein EpmB n=1 Tax=Halioglobus sp. HI00S01 TaxID=1822214 RepID=UPI0007C3B7FD|nr:EF-P beta-lysylation protein EpmB [Halioglobus sp. HI00S01]KZX58234.1 EF-P beta-lysylation protein EpmB [Halioglobus sp. HI00S01]